MITHQSLISNAGIVKLLLGVYAGLTTLLPKCGSLLDNEADIINNAPNVSDLTRIEPNIELVRFRNMIRDLHALEKNTLKNTTLAYTVNFPMDERTDTVQKMRSVSITLNYQRKYFVVRNWINFIRNRFIRSNYFKIAFPFYHNTPTDIERGIARMGLNNLIFEQDHVIDSIEITSSRQIGELMKTLFRQGLTFQNLHLHTLISTNLRPSTSIGMWFLLYY